MNSHASSSDAKAADDLTDLALVGLAAFCRARHTSMEPDEDVAFKSRQTFLIPTLVHDRAWHPLRRS